MRFLTRAASSLSGNFSHLTSLPTSLIWEMPIRPIFRIQPNTRVTISICSVSFPTFAQPPSTSSPAIVRQSDLEITTIEQPPSTSSPAIVRQSDSEITTIEQPPSTSSPLTLAPMDPDNPRTLSRRLEGNAVPMTSKINRRLALVPLSKVVELLLVG